MTFRGTRNCQDHLVYRSEIDGEKIGEGKKSYAVSFTLLDEENTLTDKQIENIMQKLINTYKEKLNAELR